MFHIGNIVFALLHTVVLVVVVVQVWQAEAASIDAMCDLSPSNDPWLRPAHSPGPEVLPTMPPNRGDPIACAEAVQEEKEHAPGRMALWMLFTLPYWACTAYAAYFSHDLYLQLRVRELTVRRGEDMGLVPGRDGRATVAWGEVSTHSPSTLPAL